MVIGQTAWMLEVAVIVYMKGGMVFYQTGFTGLT